MSVFKPDRAGFDQLARSSDLQAVATAGAEAAAEHLQEIAPTRTGAYRDSVRTQEQAGYDGRAGAIVIADIDYAWAVEFVNGDHPLQRTADWLEAQT